MPRRPRHYLPGLPYHIVQRGNNRQPCFFESEDHQDYLLLWQEVSKRYGVHVHAYCLMTNHIHFLATPTHPDSLSSTLKVVGSRYAQQANRKYQRSGTLWEGRHRASLIQTERYLLSCYRYIELNPVRAGMVEFPEDYQWSSYITNSRGEHSWLVPHQEYLSLGITPIARQQAYRGLFKVQLDNHELNLLRKAAHYSLPVGDDRFYRSIESELGMRLGQMERGRPKQQSIKK